MDDAAAAPPPPTLQEHPASQQQEQVIPAAASAESSQLVSPSPQSSTVPDMPPSSQRDPLAVSYISNTKRARADPPSQDRHAEIIQDRLDDLCDKICVFITDLRTNTYGINLCPEAQSHLIKHIISSILYEFEQPTAFIDSVVPGCNRNIHTVLIALRTMVRHAEAEERNKAEKQ